MSFHTDKLDLTTAVKLNNGVMMPVFGLGVYKSGPDTKQAVLDALGSRVSSYRYSGSVSE